MLRHLIFCVAALLACAIPSLSAAGQSATFVLADADRRSATSLNGDWHYIVDPNATGLYSFHGEIRKDGYFTNGSPEAGSDGLIEYNFAKSPTLHVPGDWNTQADKLYYYEGLIWYQRDFEYTAPAGHRTFLHVGAANYTSIAWINGVKVCQHEGGFTAFDCDITQALRAGHNFVVFAVDSTRLADGVPTKTTDWWNYGGLTRDVSLVDTPHAYVDAYDLHLNPARDAIEGSVHVVAADPGTKVSVVLQELSRSQTVTLDQDGRASIHISAEGMQFWSPTHPRLYRVRITASDDHLDDDIGFRTIQVRGSEILLNGAPIFLRGVSIHAEAPFRGGRSNTDADMNTLLGWAQELGCNYVRLAHYPHDQKMTRATDRLGLLVWSEIPVYWAEHFADPAVLHKAEQQLTEEIARDRNRASIIFWSIANETPMTPERTSFLTTLAKDVRTLDPTRLVTAALLVRGVGHEKFIDDPLGAALDVIGANEYIGWYEGKPADADITTWHLAYDKPLIMSELGADAKAGYHGSSSTRWTEEFQSDFFQHQITMLSHIPQLRGLSPWVLMDFRSPRRVLPGIEDGFNRKGLVSDQGEKKAAFSILQRAYQEGTLEHKQ